MCALTSTRSHTCLLAAPQRTHFFGTLGLENSVGSSSSLFHNNTRRTSQKSLSFHWADILGVFGLAEGWNWTKRGKAMIENKGKAASYEVAFNYTVRHNPDTFFVCERFINWTSDGKMDSCVNVCYFCDCHSSRSGTCFRMEYVLPFIWRGFYNFFELLLVIEVFLWWNNFWNKSQTTFFWLAKNNRNAAPHL